MHRFQFLFILLGLLFLFLIPPFQKPDEVVQYHKTIALASGSFTCTLHQGRPVHFMPTYLENLPQTLFTESLAYNTQVKVAKKVYLALFTQTTFDRTTATEPTSCPLNPFIYFFPAAFLFIPVQFGFHPLLIFYLGRIAIFMACSFICLQAIRLLQPSYRKVLYVVLLMPMTLQQLSSYSKDAWHIAFGVLFFSLFIHLQKKHQTNFLAKFVLLCLSGMIVVLTRIQYFALLFLVFQPLLQLDFGAEPLKKLKESKPMMTVSFFVIGFLVFVFSLRNYSMNFLTLSFASYVRDVYPAFQLQNILMDPLLFGQRLFDTFNYNFDFYLKSGVGMLGWLDTTLPYWFYVLFGGVLFSVVSTLPKELLFRKKDLFLLCVVLLIIPFTTFLSFYLFWSPVGAEIVEGVQGRYFIVLVPFAILVFANMLQRLGDKKLVVFAALVGLVGLYSLFNRYYNSSRYYYVDANGTPTKNILLLKDTHQYLLNLQPERKFMGVVLHVGKFQEKGIEPMIVEVREADCGKVLKRKVADIGQIKSGETYQIRFDRGQISGLEQVCIGLVPMGKIGDTQNIPLILDQQQQPLTQPVYLY